MSKPIVGIIMGSQSDLKVMEAASEILELLQIPFELMVVFATNLDPSDLADEAFLRRIHNKIFIEPVSPQGFDFIFQRVVTAKRLPSEPDTAEYFRTLCLRDGRRELRACYPLDICNILLSISQYEKTPVKMTRDEIGRAVNLYFAKSVGAVEQEWTRPA